MDESALPQDSHYARLTQIIRDVTDDELVVLEDGYFQFEPNRISPKAEGIATTGKREGIAPVPVCDDSSELSGMAQNAQIPVKKKRGRPPEIPDERKEHAMKEKDAKGTNRDAAKIIYEVLYPTPQQVKNVPSILRQYRAKVAKSISPAQNTRAPSRKPNKTRG